MDDLALDHVVSEFLKNTFELIPTLFADDPKTVFFLQMQKANMVGYTKKMWRALGARSIIDYVALANSTGHAFVAANPKVVLACETYAECMEAQQAWVQSELKIELTEADIDGRNALTLISQKTADLVNRKLQALLAGKKT